MVRNAKDNITPDLLDWQPPKVAVGYQPEDVRANDLAARLSRAIALAMKDCPKQRQQIADDMSAYLGEKITKSMLETYASQARETNVINMARFAALIHATDDYRLLSLLTDLFGFSVVPDKHLHVIQIGRAHV